MRLKNQRCGGLLRLTGMLMLVGSVVGLAAPMKDSKCPPAGAIPELGKVDWLRGFDKAAAEAKRQDKPLLVLFQEVPGCATCKSYGNDVLSHPLVVEAAETLFVPVVVYNNVKGDDEQTLKFFDEPAWNNPVVRFVTHDRQALADRVAKDYSVAGLAEAMVEALAKGKAKAETPEYLRLLTEESVARRRGVKKATFAMHCFWEGEKALGVEPGVISTVPGFLQGREVVELEFDPRRIDYTALVKKAQAHNCASTVFARSDQQQSDAQSLLGDSWVIRTDERIRLDKEPKYFLSKTAYKHVPMTPLQAARVNSAIARKEDPKQFLSPRQMKLLKFVTKHRTSAWPDAVTASDLIDAWGVAKRAARAIGEEL